MAGPIVNLFDETESGISTFMAGPWREVRVLTLEGGQTHSLVSDTVEHAGFVIDGDCTLTVPDSGDFTLTSNGSFALPLAGSVVITAGADGLSLLVVTMNVAEEG